MVLIPTIALIIPLFHCDNRPPITVTVFYRSFRYGIPRLCFASFVQLLILSTIHIRESTAVLSLSCLILVYIPLLAIVYICSNLLVLCLNSMSHISWTIPPLVYPSEMQGTAWGVVH